MEISYGVRTLEGGGVGRCQNQGISPSSAYLNQNAFRGLGLMSQLSVFVVKFLVWLNRRFSNGRMSRGGFAHPTKVTNFRCNIYRIEFSVPSSCRRAGR